MKTSMTDQRKKFTFSSPVCTADSYMDGLGYSGRAIEAVPPRIHGEGFAHNNCGGFCVKMGLYQCYLLWKFRLKRWMFAEEKEQEFLAYVERADISIFRKDNEPITMQALRTLFEGGWVPKKRKQNSCSSCMVPTAEELFTLI